MALQRKLLITFGGLALLVLAVAAMTVWATVKWGHTDTQLQHHYQRSLLLQRVRVAMFRAIKEVSDTTTGRATL